MRLLSHLLPGLLLVGGLTAASAPATQDLFDDTILREVRLDFMDSDWWQKLKQGWPNGPDILADLTIDGIVYQGVGVRIKGNSSYFFLPPGSQKVSLNVTVNFTDPLLRVYGMKTLNLNNGIEDPTFCREVTYQNFIYGYSPNGRGNHVKLVLNGNGWGIYENIQQYNKDMLEEFYVNEDGARFKCPNNPNGPGLRYKGANKSAYSGAYEIHDDGDLADPWQVLIDTCDRITNEPLTNYDTIDDQFSIDHAMWTVALENLFMDEDSYISKGADFHVYWDLHEGRMHLHQHDGNESFGVSFFGWPGGTLWQLSPLHNSGDVNKPVLSRLWGIPEVKQRYLAHLRTMLNGGFDWTGEMEDQILAYKAMIQAEVLADDKKIYSDQDFLDNFTQNVVISDGAGGTMTAPGLQLFVEGRRSFLLAHQAVKKKAPVIPAVWHTPVNPLPGQSTRVMARVAGPDKPVGLVKLWYQPAPGRYSQIPMLDDGQSGDGLAGDGLYAVDVPFSGGIGQRVSYYVSAASATANAPMIFSPLRTEFAPLTLAFQYGQSGVKITEYMYSGTDGEFLELTNVTSAAIDLTGWSLDDESATPGTFDLSPVGPLAAGESIVISGVDPSGFASAWNLAGTRVFGPNTLAPLGRDDTINLYDAGGQLVERLTYGDQALPGSPRAKDQSAQVCLEGLGADNAYRWQLALDGDAFGAWTSAGGDVGSPGTWIAVDCPGLGDAYCTATVNSTGAPAVLAADGDPRVAQNDLDLLCSSLPPGKFGYFIMSQTQDFRPLVGGGQGNLCLGGAIVRFAQDVQQAASDGTASFSPDLSNIPGGVLIAPGERWSFQFWYRDSNPGATSNFSNGVEIGFQ